MPFVSTTHQRYLGEAVGGGQCVALVREATGLSHTSTWRRGDRVRGGAHPPGTAIATFSPDTGKYGNHVDGRSHAAILLRQTERGLVVIDQWHGQPCHERVIRFKGGEGLPVDDGDAYHVIEI